MKISDVYIQKEYNKQYNYRFEFKNVIHKGGPSFMLYHAPYRIVGSMLSQLHEYTSLHKVNPYENIRG